MNQAGPAQDAGASSLRPRRRKYGPIVGRLRRFAFSALLSGLLLVLATLALFVTSWPAWLSLLLEPFSLLLTPGVIASMLFTMNHDYLHLPTLIGGFVFYLILLYGALAAWDRRCGR